MATDKVIPLDHCSVRTEDLGSFVAFIAACPSVITTDREVLFEEPSSKDPAVPQMFSWDRCFHKFLMDRLTTLFGARLIQLCDLDCVQALNVVDCPAMSNMLVSEPGVYVVTACHPNGFVVAVTTLRVLEPGSALGAPRGYLYLLSQLRLRTNSRDWQAVLHSDMTYRRQLLLVCDKSEESSHQQEDAQRALRRTVYPAVMTAVQDGTHVTACVVPGSAAQEHVMYDPSTDSDVLRLVVDVPWSRVLYCTVVTLTELLLGSRAGVCMRYVCTGHTQLLSAAANRLTKERRNFPGWMREFVSLATDSDFVTLKQESSTTMPRVAYVAKNTAYTPRLPPEFVKSCVKPEKTAANKLVYAVSQAVRARLRSTTVTVSAGWEAYRLSEQCMGVLVKMIGFLGQPVSSLPRTCFGFKEENPECADDAVLAIVDIAAQMDVGLVVMRCPHNMTADGLVKIQVLVCAR